KPVAVQKKTIIQPPTAQEVSPLKPPPLTKINQPPSETQSRAMVYRLIQAELVRHFQYPRLARRRGWEGTTHIEFIVEPSGKITQIRVKKGSQHGLLNRSAVDTLSRINRLKQIVPGFITAPIRMEVPIIYRLQ
ncbi:MAG: energy transducer TonB, partial [Gammaproteobacteria bacterium]|nr:energy transducer TonB [Gammaproteobacteria bacterium]